MRRFTIESNKPKPFKDDATEETQNLDKADNGAENHVTLEKIKDAVTHIVRNELNAWVPPSTDGESAGCDGPQLNAEDKVTKDIFAELGEIQSHIATTRQEIAALKPEEGSQSQFCAAKSELQEIVDATARATNDILSEAEKVSEISGNLTDRLADDQIEAVREDIEALDGASMQIMLACGFQDLTGQRINKVVNTLIFVEEKINRLVELWNIADGTGSSSLVATRAGDERPDQDLLNGPQKDGEGISQDDIDAMFA